MIFETTRLSVRNLTDSDFAAFHEMQSDDGVMQYTTGKGLDEAENRRQLKMCIDSYSKPDNDFWVWAIVRRSDQQFVGTCAIVPNEQRAEIGYRFLRRFFGLGYGQEICNGLIEYGMHEHRLSEIIAYADVRNVASVKILERSPLPFIEAMRNEDGGVDRFYRWTADPASADASDDRAEQDARPRTDDGSETPAARGEQPDPGQFELWLETDHLEPLDRQSEGFCNISVTLQDGRKYALNVWTFDFLASARYPWPYEPSGDAQPADYVLPPDLFVTSLDRRTIESVLSELIETEQMKEEWLVDADDGRRDESAFPRPAR